MNGLLFLLNSKYMALHFKPNEAVTDTEVRCITKNIV